MTRVHGGTDLLRGSLLLWTVSLSLFFFKPPSVLFFVLLLKKGGVRGDRERVRATGSGRWSGGEEKRREEEGEGTVELDDAVRGCVPDRLFSPFSLFLSLSHHHHSDSLTLSLSLSLFLSLSLVLGIPYPASLTIIVLRYGGRCLHQSVFRLHIWILFLKARHCGSSVSPFPRSLVSCLNVPG